MNAAEIAEKQNQQIADVKAGEAAAKIHAFDKAAEIAARVKDAAALERALLGKLEAQRDFAAAYKARFPHEGAPKGSRNAAKQK
jgi:hypothetical protein